jgi:hypothetical protein
VDAENPRSLPLATTLFIIAAILSGLAGVGSMFLPWLPCPGLSRPVMHVHFREGDAVQTFFLPCGCCNDRLKVSPWQNFRWALRKFSTCPRCQGNGIDPSVSSP